MVERIFSEWHEKHTRLWGKQPLRFKHTLHTSELFSLETLAALIDRYPREHYSLMSVGARNERRLWAENSREEMSGAQIIAAICKGRFWLNLRRTNDIDPRYAEFLDQMFEEIGGRIKDQDGFPMRSLGILISSPTAHVYYHADLPNQSLWQIRGRKRVYIYPPADPFITGEDLERISIQEVEVDMPYFDWYDEHAAVFELVAGEMLHWPLNAPHRVENLGELNISVSTEYWSTESSRRYRLNMANGALRHILKLAPRGRATSGPAFIAKSLLWSAVSRTGWLERVRARRRADALRSEYVELADRG